MALALCLGTAPVMAQNSRVTLSSGAMTLRKAISEIEKQTGDRFGVSERMDLSKVVNFGKTSLTVAEAAQKIAGDEFSYIYNNGVLLFTSKPTGDADGQANHVMVDDAELKRIAGSPKSYSDSQITALVYGGPRHTTTDDKTFHTPGSEIQGGLVPQPFETAQRVERSKIALKTNLLYWATLTPNLQMEFGLGNRTTLDVAGAYNPWNLDGTKENNRKLVHWLALAEFRYWLCERLAGSFFGVHALGSMYNVGGRKVPMLFEKKYRYEGWGIGGGISYGYVLPLAKRWSAEFNVGVGVIYMDYDKYGCDKCAELVERKDKTYFGPTRLGISLVYMIK